MQSQVELGQAVQQVLGRLAWHQGRDHPRCCRQRTGQVLVEFARHHTQRHAGMVQAGTWMAQGCQGHFGGGQESAQGGDLVAVQAVGVARAVQVLVVLGHGAGDVFRIVGQLADQQLAHVWVDDQLAVGVRIQRFAGIGLAELGGDVHLAHVMHQARSHGPGDQVRIGPAAERLRVHQGARQGHGLDGVRKRGGPRTLARAQQQLHHGMQAHALSPLLQCRGMQPQQRGQGAICFNEVLNRHAQGLCGDAIFGNQAGLQGLLERAVHQLALQLAGHGLVARPQFHPVDVEDVAGGDDRPGFAGLQDDGQGMGVGGLETDFAQGRGHGSLLVRHHRRINEDSRPGLRD